MGVMIAPFPLCAESDAQPSWCGASLWAEGDLIHRLLKCSDGPDSCSATIGASLISPSADEFFASNYRGLYGLGLSIVQNSDHSLVEDGQIGLI